ncbi:hypoxanthine-guanine phosphoribosyltransferase [Aliikangiella coralliicola]|uniref:Hypoxanthine-guanine phosphoribosyltransferase n=1 Tax=Aliikangiella coralliicola TaxID=2592383 RepID=A0A545UG04_9GAMM|nr:hypoxanthine-guanine phosphoribosyltransferase [Aliikangiella coralliicola]TQV88398.1 hypoxanthine-guanine phosphoribosyltransferase [Aliikangiella coralliicola]
MDIDTLNQIKNNATLLHDNQRIESALSCLVEKLTLDYANKNPIFLVVMNGGLIFAGQLLSRLKFPAQIDYCHATRYRGNTSGGEIGWKVEPHMDLAGRHVVILDDILDEGHTLKAIIEHCRSRKAQSVKTLVLIEKIHDRKASPGMRPDYCELETPDKYVFGYGMDYNHYWRNSDEIYIFNPERNDTE